MTFETPPLKLPQIAVLPPGTTVWTALDPQPPRVAPNFIEPNVSASSYALPICPSCWGIARSWSYQNCVLLQRPVIF